MRLSLQPTGTLVSFVNTFASGSLVPKAYIWPVDETDYLQAHEEELEFFVSILRMVFHLASVTVMIL